VHEHLGPLDRPISEHRPVRSDTRDTEAGAGLVVDLLRQRDGQLIGDDGVLSGRAERPVGLGAVNPDPLSGSVGVDALTDLVDRAGAVAVRHHPGEGHGGAEPAAPLLGVSRVDP